MGIERGPKPINIPLGTEKTPESTPDREALGSSLDKLLTKTELVGSREVSSLKQYFDALDNVKVAELAQALNMEGTSLSAIGWIENGEQATTVQALLTTWEQTPIAADKKRELDLLIAYLKKL